MCWVENLLIEQDGKSVSRMGKYENDNQVDSFIWHLGVGH